MTTQVILITTSWWSVLVISDIEVSGLSACARHLSSVASRVLPLRRVLRLSALSETRWVCVDRGGYTQRKFKQSERDCATGGSEGATRQQQYRRNDRATMHSCQTQRTAQHRATN